MNSDSQNVKVKARIRIGKQYPELKLVEVPAAVLSRVWMLFCIKCFTVFMNKYYAALCLSHTLC